MYYKKVREQVEKAGYPVVDFSGHEYDKYFLKDTIHLGWKGWIYFDEAVQKFNSEIKYRNRNGYEPFRFFSIEDFGEDNLGMHVYLESVYNHNVSLRTGLDKVFIHI